MQTKGPVRIQYKCLVLIYIFPEMKLLFPKQNYIVLSPSFYTHIFVRVQDRSAYSAAGKYVDQSWEYVKSLTDTWMWKLFLRPRSTQFPEKEYINGIFLAVWLWFMYSRKWEMRETVSVRPWYFQNHTITFCLPISTFMYLWTIHIFPWSVFPSSGLGNI